MATNVLTLRRSPADILLDVRTTKDRLRSYYARLDDLSDAEERAWHDLEERLTVLQAEADAELMRLTGVRFDAWEGAFA